MYVKETTGYTSPAMEKMLAIQHIKSEKMSESSMKFRLTWPVRRLAIKTSFEWPIRVVTSYGGRRRRRRFNKIYDVSISPVQRKERR